MDVALAVRPGGARFVARVPPEHQGPPADDQGSRQADPRFRAADRLCRRRRAEGPRGRGAARVGRADRRLRRDHADGPRCVPRRPSALSGHAGHARQRHGGHVDAEVGSADHARRPLRRSHHRQGRRVRPRGEDHPRRHRSRPSRARCAGPTSRSSATPSTSSRRSSARSRRCSPAVSTQADTSAWKSTVSGWREQFPMTYEQSEPGAALKPQYCIEAAQPARAAAHDRGVRRRPASDVHLAVLRRSTSRTPGSTPVVSARWASRSPPRSAPRRAKPERDVWAVDGDGCFQMTAQELVTATLEGFPIKVALLNNGYLGMVRQWQEMFYDERYSEVFLELELPDFVMWAESMGCVGLSGRVARGGRADHREGELDQRPSGRHRVPHRCIREGVPDGAGRRQQRRPDPPPDRSRTGRTPEGDGIMTTINQYGGQTLNHHILSVLVQNRPACSPGWPGCSPAAATTSSRWRSLRPRTRGCSRITIVVDRRLGTARADHQAAVQADRRRSRSPNSTPAARSSASC